MFKVTETPDSVLGGVCVKRYPPTNSMDLNLCKEETLYSRNFRFEYRLVLISLVTYTYEKIFYS